MISIVLPNLNTPLDFLDERIKSILNQSFQDWECIIVDGFSDNGSAEVLKDLSNQDNRFIFFQRERKGIYDAWNEGIKLVKYDYVYIATSDDTMADDFFEKMLLGFSKAPHCGIACSYVTFIDENSNPINNIKWENFGAGKYFGDLLKSSHLREAPHDGILHSIVGMLYTSITQLLIKKKVFEKIGLFLVNKGSIADFEWEMRASFLFSVLYIPNDIATWRKYAGQATIENYNNAAYYKSLVSLVKLAYNTAVEINPALKNKISLKESTFSFTLEEHRFNIKEARGLFNKIKAVATCFILRPDVGIYFFLEAIKLRKRFESVKYAKYVLRNKGIKTIS